MILREVLKNVIISQKEQFTSRNLGIKRDLLKKIDLNVPHATIISGVRRCGKSTLLKQLMQNTKNPNYFNFEDTRLTNFEVSDFLRLNETFNELNKSGKYYFFDEIQNVPGWEIFVRELLDKGKKCIITGSNASLLSRELGTKLTGRHLDYELYPFSYKETLNFLSLKNSKNSFDKYVKYGGFPEYLKFKRIEMLQELFEDSLLRDMIVRYNLKDEKPIKQLALFLATNISKKVSYNKLAKNLSFKSANTVISYLGYFEDGYLFFRVPKYDHSYKRQLISPKKIYSVDVALSRANSLSFSPDTGRVLENLVYLNLIKRFKNVMYHENETECDFVVNDKVKLAVQVCKNLNDENVQRETQGLLNAMNELKLNEGTILTYDQTDTILLKGKKINIVPIRNYLHENS